MANYGTKQFAVNSIIYKMFQNGSLSLYQRIATQAASNVKFFRPQGMRDGYLVIANMMDDFGNTAIASKV